MASVNLPGIQGSGNLQRRALIGHVHHSGEAILASVRYLKCGNSHDRRMEVLRHYISGPLGLPLDFECGGETLIARWTWRQSMPTRKPEPSRQPTPPRPPSTPSRPTEQPRQPEPNRHQLMKRPQGGIFLRPPGSKCMNAERMPARCGKLNAAPSICKSNLSFPRQNSRACGVADTLKSRRWAGSATALPVQSHN